MDGSRLARIEETASRQRSLVTRSQLIAEGVGRATVDRWVARGRLVVVHDGVYRLRGHPVTWEQEVLAAIMAVGPPVAATGRTAGRLWALEDVEPGGIELLVPADRAIARRGVWVRRTTSFSKREVVCVEGIPRTTPPRTLVELAADLPSLSLEIALDDALRRRMTTVPTMLRRLERLGTRGRTGAGLLREFLLDRLGDGTSGSGWETRLWRLLVAGGLPTPIRQFRVRDPAGRYVGRIDLAYPDVKVGIEFDGFRHHTGRRRYDQDVRRQNRLEDLGWRFRRFTSTAVRAEEPEIVTTVTRAVELTSLKP